MKAAGGTERVETVVMSNLDAAYRLARWHFRDDGDAESVVHEASRRAFRKATTFSGGIGRAWFLRIVSLVSVEWGARSAATATALDVVPHSDDLSSLEAAIRSLPSQQREVLVLREVEGLSYSELAEVTGVPVDVVAANLSRGRQALGRALADVQSWCRKGHECRGML